MPDKVTVLEDKGIILVETYGKVTEKDIKESLKKVVEIQQITGLKDLLVDATNQTSLPATFPLFDFGSKLAATLRGTRIAIVSSPGTHMDLEFLETVIVNRGGQIKVFNSFEDAYAWL